MNDAGQFTQVLRTLPVAGNDIYLLIEEITVGISLNHIWEITVTPKETFTEVFDCECTSPGFANNPTDQLMSITTNGTLHGHDISEGETAMFRSKELRPADQKIEVYPVLACVTMRTMIAVSGALRAPPARTPIPMKQILLRLRL